MSTVQVPIHSRKYPNLVALVDEEDAALVLQYRWNIFVSRPHSAHPRLYVKARISPNQFVYLHHLILPPKPGHEVDHWSGDGLDNRRGNLRECTSAGNNQNRAKRSGSASSYCGVERNKKRWIARIKSSNQGIYLGSFASEIEAALAYDDAARIHHREYATLNFPRPGERGVHDSR